MDPLIGREISHCTITDKVGEGGMAVVYKAHQPSLNRDVAIKILTGPLARDEEFVLRFRREAVAAGALGHPNILTIYDAGTTHDGLHYIVMEYVPGGTLKEFMERGPLPVDRARHIVAQIADALQAAHQHGIVHRDLKPSNILFTRDGRPLLMDFGVALTAAGTRLTRTGMAVGTPEYMSPEQAQGLAVDGRSDIYSLGIMIYEMLTGEVPFVSDTPLATLYQHVHNAISKSALLDSGVPDWLSTVVQQTLSKRPEDRYQTAREMAAALRREGGTPVSAPPPRAEIPAAPVAPPPAVAAPTVRRRGRGLLWTVGIIAGIAVVAGVTYALFFRTPPEGRPTSGTAQRVVLVQPTDTPSMKPVDTSAGPATSEAQASQEQTVTAMAIATAEAMAAATAEAQETEIAEASAQSTQVAQSQTATAAAAVISTAEAKETEIAKAVAQSSKVAQDATATSVALTAEAQRNLADSLTATAQATLTAEARSSTQTAEAPPTPTATPLPPTSTPTPARRREISDFETEEVWRRGDEPYGTLVRSTEEVHSGSYSGKLAYNFPTSGNDYVVFQHDQPLAGEPDGLSVWVHGDGSGHFLNAWIRDAQGQLWQTTFGQIAHQGWKRVTASLVPGQKWPWAYISGPNNGRVDYPIDFQAVVLDDVPDGFTGSGAIYLDELVSETLGVGQPGETPAPAAATPPPVVAPALSGTIAFPVFNPQRGRYDVYVASTDGSGRRVVVQEARQPDFRDDGRLAVNGDGGGRDNIWSMNRDGGDARAISRHPEDAHPSWSGDGGRIAFDSLLGQDKSAPRIYVHDDLSAKHEPRMVMFASYEIRGRVSTWLSDGRIVFNGCNYWDTGGNCGLYAVGDGGGQPSRLTSSANDTAADAHGSRIAFMSLRDGNWEVYVMNWDGGDQQNLTRSPGNDGLPTWSPDGQWIAFVSDRSGQWAVWAMRPDGSEPRQLFSLEGSFGSGDYDWSLERLSWGP